MADVPKFAVFVPPAGHSDKQAVGTLDNFDVMQGKVVVDGNRNKGAQAIFAVGASDADVGDVHVSSSFVSNRYCYSARLVKKYAEDREFLWILFALGRFIFYMGCNIIKETQCIQLIFWKRR